MSRIQTVYADWAKGALTGGASSAYYTLDAVTRGDWEEVAYWVKVEIAVLGSQWTALQILNMIQGPKYAMSFHAMHAGLGPARGMIARQFWPVAVHYGMKYWLGETDTTGAIHGYDVTREQRIQQYSGYKIR